MIKLDQVSFKYNESTEYIIKKLSIEFNSGDFVGIVGPNGSGKTTLIKIIANLLLPQEGNCLLNKKKYNSYKNQEFYKLVSYVPQNISVTYPFTVYELVMMGRAPNLSSYGIPKDIDVQIVEEKLKIMDIWNLRNKTIDKLSGGELQRVLIARALAQNTDVILFDEPSSFLDYRHQVEIFKVLIELNKAGKIIVLISHDLNLLSCYADKLAVIKNGELKYFDKVQNILTKNILNDIYETEFEIYSHNNKKIITLAV
jgi:iron complex transport system ATP-binding protein